MSDCFVIHNSNGDTTVTKLTDVELADRIAESYYGPIHIFREMPAERDTNYWGNQMLIIRGKIL